MAYKFNPFTGTFDVVVDQSSLPAHDHSGDILNPDAITLNKVYTPDEIALLPVGTKFWDADNHCFSTKLEYGVIIQDGQELQKFGTDEGNNFFEGACVSAKGVTGNRVAFELTDFSSTSTNYNHFTGLITSAPDSGNRFALLIGDINGIDTTGGLSYNGLETWNENDNLWGDYLNAGYMTNVEPPAGSSKVYIGKITIKHGSVGQISTMYKVFSKIEDSSNVDGIATTLNDTDYHLFKDITTGIWKKITHSNLVVKLKEKFQDKTLYFANKQVLITDWISDTTYSGYGYKAVITCANVTSTMLSEVTFAPTESNSGNYASVCLSGTNTVTIYAVNVPTSTITIPTIKAEVTE